jgi:hypothetical protein
MGVDTLMIAGAVPVLPPARPTQPNITNQTSPHYAEALEREVLRRYGVKPDQANTYAPEVTVFFAFLAELKPNRFAERMLSIDQQFVVKALASDHIAWSRQILHKHRWVDRAFIFTGITLGFFICVAVSYMIRVGLAE